MKVLYRKRVWLNIFLWVIKYWKKGENYFFYINGIKICYHFSKSYINVFALYLKLMSLSKHVYFLTLYKNFNYGCKHLCLILFYFYTQWLVCLIYTHSCIHILLLWKIFTYDFTGDYIDKLLWIKSDDVIGTRDKSTYYFFLFIIFKFHALKI